MTNLNISSKSPIKTVRRKTLGENSKTNKMKAKVISYIPQCFYFFREIFIFAGMSTCNGKNTSKSVPSHRVFMQMILIIVLPFPKMYSALCIPGPYQLGSLHVAGVVISCAYLSRHLCCHFRYSSSGSLTRGGVKRFQWRS